MRTNAQSAITKVLSTTWQRCIASAWIGTALAQDDAAAAGKQWRQIANQARPRVLK